MAENDLNYKAGADIQNVARDMQKLIKMSDHM